MKIGLYFGSFNPVHNGHMIIASFMRQHTDLEQVWMVVSPQNPFKTNQSLLNEYQRLHLVKIAAEQDLAIKAIDIEFHLPRPSYTINTLTYLEEKYPQHEFAIIMGSDSLMNLDKWKSSNIIMDRYSIYVYERPGFPINKTLPIKNLVETKAPLLEISASMVRKMIRDGKSIRYFVPDNVLEDIQQNGFYKTKEKKI